MADIQKNQLSTEINDSLNKADSALQSTDIGTSVQAYDADTTTESNTQALENKDFTSGTNTFPTFNQNTTGTASNVSGTPALPNGTTATTQSASDNSTKLATTAYVDAAAGGGGGSTTSVTVGEAVSSGDYLRLPIEKLIAEQLTGDNGKDQIDTVVGFGDSNKYQRQTITLSETLTNPTITLSLRKTSAPVVDNFEIGIYKTSDNTLVTSVANVAGGDMTMDYDDYTVSLTGTLTLTTSEAYYIRGSRSGANSGSHYFDWESNSSNAGYTGGVGSNGNYLFTWTSNSTDHVFQIKESESTNKHYLTDATSSLSIDFVGVASEDGAADETIDMITPPIDNTRTGLTLGDIYYLSDTPGEISTTPGTNSKRVGKVISSTAILMDGLF